MVVGEGRAAAHGPRANQKEHTPSMTSPHVTSPHLQDGRRPGEGDRLAQGDWQRRARGGADGRQSGQSPGSGSCGRDRSCLLAAWWACHVSAFRAGARARREAVREAARSDGRKQKGVC